MACARSRDARRPRLLFSVALSGSDDLGLGVNWRARREVHAAFGVFDIGACIRFSGRDT